MTRNVRDLAQDLLYLIVLLLVPACLYVVFAVVPTEQRMGVVQRIFYFHVPCAFAAFLGVALCALFSALYLKTRDRRHDIVAHASAELGVLFCTIVLVTGPIWARPVWGVWWTGEVRLTSTLVLWLIYVGYLVLRQNAENPDQAARWGAVVGIVGALDVPIIYKSVEWWRGLHPRVLKVSGGGGLDPAMEKALMLCTVTILLLFLYLLIQRSRLGLLQEQIEALAFAERRAPASAGAAPHPTGARS
ncbi:MAG TPA: cytochrome c biogenesis protein [Candidatus Polarisedimenticolia bacterium]|nr:cytochrome c biogenesis protein [Candidatus Polarisedimenticolia bacterium]